MVFSTEAEEGLYNLCFHACPNYKDRDSFNLQFDVNLMSLRFLTLNFHRQKKFNLRLTSRKIIKEIILALVRCRCPLCTQWCRCYFSCLDYFGFSYWKKASMCRRWHPCWFQNFIYSLISLQTHSLQNTLHNGRARVSQIIVVNVPFNQLSFH